jgi:hypothetical protein
MSDDTFKQSRRRINPEDLGENPLDGVRNVQEAVAKETGRESSAIANDSPIDIKGAIPPEFKKMLEQRRAADQSPDEQVQRPRMNRTMPVPDSQAARQRGSTELENILEQLAEKHQWEDFEFCSCGKFYKTVPPVVHIRPMTGEEEQILATPRFVKKGKAIDMIFDRCIQEKINTEELLSVDRTHLLIYLRGISYTPEYDVEITCPGCTQKFSTTINLDLPVTKCPEDFDESKLSGVLPTSGLKYRYRLATGGDELEVTNYRERRIQMFGDQGEDDTLLFRTAMLLENIEGVTNRKELQVLLKKLPINDVSHLRNEINDPPFGVETEVPMVCPSCTNEFKIDLPLEANFFFPKKKEKNQA